MMQIDDVAIQALEASIDNRIKTLAVNKNSSHVAEVVDIDAEGTVWIHIFGGAERTPVTSSLASVSKGEIVTATISNGSVIIDGSQSAPAASVNYVDQVNEAVATYAKQAISAILTDIVRIKTAIIDKATVNQLLAMNATVNELVASYANLNTLVAGKADLAYVQANYADIDFANVTGMNVGVAKMVELLANSGVFENLTYTNGTVTGQLKSVEVIGDLIRANTIAADKIIFQGTDAYGNQNGLWYRLNETGAGNLSAEELQLEKYRDALDGSNIVSKSITATQINTQSLAADTAFINDIISKTLLAERVQVGMSNATHVVMQGDRLSFIASDGAEVAYIAVDENLTESVFYITKAVVVKDLRFGKWKWYDRVNGNMALKWMG